MRLRLKAKDGTVTISPDALTTLYQFIQDIQAIEAINPGATDGVIAIKAGFPPKALDLSNTEVALGDTSVNDGDQLIVEFGGKRRKVEEKVLPPASKHSDIPSLYISELGQHLILRNIPDDNSCLFNAISYAVNGADSYKTFSPPGELRQTVVEYIEKRPETYTEVVLGQEPSKYCHWITKKDSWGGAIELGILAERFDVRINCLDIELDKYIVFNDEEDAKLTIILIYSGIHYDLLVLNKKLSLEGRENDVTQWNVGTREEKLVLEYGLKLGALLQSQNYATNTTTFRIRCLDCYEILVGEMGASKHAEKTGHYSFGEVK